MNLYYLHFVPIHTLANEPPMLVGFVVGASIFSPLSGDVICECSAGGEQRKAPLGC